jgi:hypothetical protein
MAVAVGILRDEVFSVFQPSPVLTLSAIFAVLGSAFQATAVRSRSAIWVGLSSTATSKVVKLARREANRLVGVLTHCMTPW